jgi:hypothetical protein
MGWMTNHILASYAAQNVQKLRNEPKGAHPAVPEVCARGGRMTHRFFARDGLPLNPRQKLRNEPKASNPGVPEATKAELIGLL